MQNYCEISTPKGVMRGFFHTPQNKEPSHYTHHKTKSFLSVSSSMDLQDVIQEPSFHMFNSQGC